MANLSKEKGLEPVPQGAFTGFCIGIQGSNDQTIDNIQRTVMAYSESGSDSQRAIKLWETNSFYTETLII